MRKRKPNLEALLTAAIADIPHNCTYCGLGGSDEKYCEYHDRPICEFDLLNGCRAWEWRGIAKTKKLFFHDQSVKISFKDVNENNFIKLSDLNKEQLKKLCVELDLITGSVPCNLSQEESEIRLLINEKEKTYLTDFNKRDLYEFRKEVTKYLNNEK